MKHYFYAAILLCGLLCLSLSMSVSAQTDSNMPPRPVPPSKPAAEPTAEPVKPQEGGKIVLHLYPDQRAWTVVQWQDKFGQWHDIHSWQGDAAWDEQNQEWIVEWWVARENFSEGPFRWTGYADQSQNQRKFVTASFTLPDQAGQVTHVSVHD